MGRFAIRSRHDIAGEVLLVPALEVIDKELHREVAVGVEWGGDGREHARE
jgi:hypothetical protein